MSKGSGSNTTTQKADPWSGQQPYLTDLYAKAQRLPTQQFFPGQTFATPSDLMLQEQDSSVELDKEY